MPIIVSENNGSTRDTSSLTFGRRIIDRNQTTASMRDFFNPSQPIVMYSNPVTGASVETQAIRPGIDFGSSLTSPIDANADGIQDLDSNGLGAYTYGDASAGTLTPNYAIGLPANRIHMADRDDLSEDDLKIDTNGQYDEYFDHQAVQFNLTYAADNWELKYIGGYTDFYYDRNTDEDKTGSTRLGSDDFYVLQENENWQHEVQFNFDTERLSVTMGAFIYESTINQRLDLYDPLDTQGRFQADGNYSGLTGGTAEFGGALEVLGALGILGDTGAQTAPLLDIYTAQRLAEAGALGFDGNGSAIQIAPWYGDTGTGLRGAQHDGESTPGTFFAWDNDIKTKAYAAYTQGEYEFNEQWSLTLGVRYAKDEKTVKERLLGQQESIGLTGLAMFDLGGNPGAGTLDYIVNNGADFAACGSGANLLCLYNGVTGAIDPSDVLASGTIAVGDQGTNPGDEPVRFTGVPIAFNVYRPLENDWDVWTWRANIDYQPNEDTLLYLSATTGWRSGGYNLGFLSTATPEYDEENILAYELGYKGTLLDGRMQLNTSIYLYQYDDIHTIVTQAGGLLGTSTNVVNFPEAETYGWEGDVTYLLGDRLTLGGNWSYTKAEYTKEFEVIDTTNPLLPGSIFTAAERAFAFDDATLPKIPEWKFTLWGSYSWPLGDAGTLDFFSSVGWTDEYYFDAPFERDLERTPSFTRWDARVSWLSVSEQWEVSGFVNNILDELGVRALESEGEDLNFQRKVTTTDPQVFGLSVAYRMTR